jgi:hypothetical protein
MRKHYLLLTAFVTCHALLVSAQDNAIIRIDGLIRDAATGEAIPYATVSLAANSITTISNDSGFFTIKIPTSARGDTIYVSHIGYRNVGFTIPGSASANAASSSDDASLTITLQRAPVQLPDITVTSVSPLTIIDKAIANIPVNYPTRPFVSLGFYRKDSHYDQKIIEISEAVFDVYSPDNDRKNMQFRLIKARADRDVTALGGINYFVGMSPDNLLDRDMVSRIHQTQILGDEGRNDHRFSYGGLIDYEGRPAYTIDFDQKEDIQRPLFKGRVIIDTATMAFLCFDYGLSPKGIAYRSSGQTPLRGQMLANRFTILYRRYGAKYYLNQVTITARMHLYIEGDPSVRLDTLLTRLDYLVTRVDTGFIAYSKVGKTIDNTKAIEKQIRENAGKKAQEYWENYNLIAADYNVDSALNVIRTNNEAPKKRGH